jgi:hypothetical protein
MSIFKKGGRAVSKSLSSSGSNSNAKNLKNSILELIVYGDADSSRLESPGLTVGSYSKKVKAHVEEMKRSASMCGLPSVSANQYGLEYNIFLMSKMLIDNKWHHYENLKPNSYDVYINPRIDEVSKVNDYFKLV